MPVEAPAPVDDEHLAAGDALLKSGVGQNEAKRNIREDDHQPDETTDADDHPDWSKPEKYRGKYAGDLNQGPAAVEVRAVEQIEAEAEVKRLIKMAGIRENTVAWNRAYVRGMSLGLAALAK